MTYFGCRFLFKKYGMVKDPMGRAFLLRCTGPELFWILTFSTGMLALSAPAGVNLSAIRMQVVEVFVLLGLLYVNKNKPTFSLPLCLYTIYLVWLLIGLSYTLSVGYGIRVILKYLYPFLIVTFASSVVRNHEIFLKASFWARWVALATLFFFFVPGMNLLVRGVFWGGAPAGTHYINMCIFSLAMFYFTNEKKKNIIYTILFALPCLIGVYRTDIMGTAMALAAFFFIKYRLKSLPVIACLLVLFIASVFFVPAIKNKMFINSDKITVEQLYNGEISKENINTSGRKVVWENSLRWFYKGKEMIGSGTGRLQTYFYAEAIGWQRGGQVHNDFIQILCDNGLIGLILYLTAVVAVFIHCFYIYHKRSVSAAVRICAITAGATMLGVTLTMYSDNTVSFSMATLGFPWGFYGMALGLLKK